MTQNKVLNWVSHAGSLACVRWVCGHLKCQHSWSRFVSIVHLAFIPLGCSHHLKNLKNCGKLIEFEWFKCHVLHLPCTPDRVSIVKCFGHLSMSTFKCTVVPLAHVFSKNIPRAARHSLVVMYQRTRMGGMHDNDIHSSFTRPFSQRARTTDGIPLWLSPSQLVLQLSLETVLLWCHT